MGTRLLLKAGTLVDGTGAPGSVGDVLIAGERIAATGRFSAPGDADVFDCTGLIVAPGFVDAHSHSDLQAIEGRPEKLRQGVTSEVVGNCGFSAYPAPPDRTNLHEFANPILHGAGDWGWPSARAYLESARAADASTNVASLVGHGTLRIAVAGWKQGELSASEMDHMEGMLAEALESGAAGFSTGLMYAPGSSAPVEELERLCRVVARHDAVYATHMRDYAGGLVKAVEEQLGIAWRAGCRLQISHLQAVGRSNWPLQVRAIERIQAAGAAGIDVAFDCYPYTRGSTAITQLLPQWALENGIRALLARLADRDERRRIARETSVALEQGWDGIAISGVRSGANRDVIGRTLAQIAEDRAVDPAEAALALLEAEQGSVNIVTLNQSEENLRAALTHPLSMIISDGFYVDGRPHPRLYGAFPAWLAMCRDNAWMPLEEAIAKISGLPAQRFHLRDRGRLVPGCFADVTVFDARTIGSPSTYDQPELPPRGIVAVYRDGARCAPR